jgi:hypothetical protein
LRQVAGKRAGQGSAFLAAVNARINSCKKAAMNVKRGPAGLRDLPSAGTVLLWSAINA